MKVVNRRIRIILCIQKLNLKHLKQSKNLKLVPIKTEQTTNRSSTRKSES
jgi:hypothetical protein